MPFVQSVAEEVHDVITDMAHIVKLNVGGTRYETSVSTMLNYPGSLLTTLILRPEMDVMIDNNNELFIDRDGELFKYILRYFRAGDLIVLPDGDELTLQLLLLEAKYFKLERLEAIIENKLRALTKDGWKVGDILTEADLAGRSALLYGHVHSIGTVVKFRTDGNVAVRFESPNEAGSVMRFVTLLPKQA